MKIKLKTKKVKGGIIPYYDFMRKGIRVVREFINGKWYQTLFLRDKQLSKKERISFIKIRSKHTEFMDQKTAEGWRRMVRK